MQKITPLTQPIVHPAAAKSVPAIQLPRRDLQVKAGPKILSWNEKLAALKAMNLYSGSGALPATTINLTLQNHVQTVNGVYASTFYTAPNCVWPGLFGTGVALFANSTTPFSAGNAQSLPTLGIDFKPLPNKKYLFDVGLEGNTGSYYIHVQVDRSTAFQQTMTNTGRLLIVFPGTTNPGESFIAIRGNIPGRPWWTWYGCQITEI
jgi:hypothetical protein